MIPRDARSAPGMQPHTPLRPYGVISRTTGHLPGAGVLPSTEGRVTVAARRTPSSIGTSTSCATVLYVAGGNCGGGDSAAFAGATKTALNRTARASVRTVGQRCAVRVTYGVGAPLRLSR